MAQNPVEKTASNLADMAKGVFLTILPVVTSMIAYDLLLKDTVAKWKLKMKNN